MPPWNDLKCEKFTYICSLINKAFLMEKQTNKQKTKTKNWLQGELLLSEENFKS